MFQHTSVWLVVVFVANHAIVAADSPDYLRDVKPVLKKHCWSCHGGLKQEGGLRLDTGALARAGGDNGAAVIPGDADSSSLVERIRSTDDSLRMPLEGERLPEQDIQTLIQWVNSGAKSPADEKPQRDPRHHWAFQTPVRPDVPDVDWQSGLEGEHIRNPIDALIAAQQQESGLTPVRGASPGVLLRRATLDMTGLPPTPSAVREFENDASDTAWQQVVDRLLDDDAYGERWGRHWMDVWRYSDWYGRRRVNDVRNSYPHIWRWRDWIINSLNKDTGYDEMVRMMLAADELDPENDENIVALGFIVRNWFSLNHDTWMQDLVEHTGKAFLGLRLNCAHCHDHKYDPITQEEYFRFRAFFEPLELRHDRVPGGPALTKYIRYKPGSGSSLKPIAAGLARVYDENHDAETFMYRLGDARDRFDRPPVEPGTPGILRGELELASVELPSAAWYPGLKEFVSREEITRCEATIKDAEEKLASAEAELTENEPELVAAVQEADAKLAARKQELAGTQELTRALSGEQSLYLEGKSGRSCLENPLTSVTTIDDETEIRFVVRLETDTHTALGLTLDMQTGRTGGYVAFKAGRIVSYRAGGKHAEFAPGSYDFAKGQNTFEVTLDLQPSKDQFLLTVVDRSDEDSERIIVDSVPCALHGWNHARNPAHVLGLDARTGSAAVYDNIRIGPRNGDALLFSDFEHPKYPANAALSGQDGWKQSKWRVAPGTAVASRLVETSTELAQAELENRGTHRALEAVRLNVDAARGRLNAAKLERAAIQARANADRQRFIEGLASDQITELITETGKSERQAQLALAKADHAEAELGLAQAEALPLSDDKRAAAVTAGTKQVAQTQSNLNAKLAAANKPSTTYTPFSPSYPQTSTGRRRALAEWLTHPENPLPARVAVNHIWMRHFGRPIVESVSDFGNSGAQPTHPDLLDWLAVEFIESGWSMKHIHRLILTSQTYRQSSAASQSSLKADPQNRLVWRFAPRRLEAEALRDSMLAVSGRLDRTIGGQEIDPKQEAQSLRRSLYFSVYPEAGGVMPFLKQFDAADPCDCYRRAASIVPQQALAMNNSDLAQNESRHTADRLLSELKDDAEDRLGRITDSAFLACLSRECTAKERELAIDFLGRQLALYGEADDAERRAAASLVRALFSHTEFVTLR